MKGYVFEFEINFFLGEVLGNVILRSYGKEFKLSIF